MSAMLLVSKTGAVAQTVDDFFRQKGTYDLFKAAHPSNDYLHGTHDVFDRYIDIFLIGRDNVAGGDVHTRLRVMKGIGGLYFNEIIILGDDDPFAHPFEFFEMEAKTVMALAEGIDKATYNDMRAKLQQLFHTDIDHWTGKMWALFGLNLDYAEYMLSQH